MGKKSRGKKRRKDWIRQAPVEVLSRGPIRLERYGRHIRVLNTSTPEEHAAVLERVKEVNSQVLFDLACQLTDLQALIAKYDPVELMFRATFMHVTTSMKYRSESEFQADESYFLPTVEYLQYLIARTERNTDGKAPFEAEFDEVWEKALKVMQLTESHLMARGTLTNPPNELDALRFIHDNRRLMMRVKRYSIFLPDHWGSALTPYEHQIKEVYGLGVEEIIHGLRQIDEYQTRGVTRRHTEVFDLRDKFLEKLQELGIQDDSGAKREGVEDSQNAFETGEFKVMIDEIQEKLRLTFTSALFEITDLTPLPKSFLSLLSVKPGESILTTLTGPEHDDLSPLSTSVLHYKPFLEVDGRFYTSYHSGLQDHLADLIEADLFEKRPTQVTEMAKRRSDRLESDVKELLSSIIRPDFEYQNVYYPNPDDAGNLAELDLLLGVDDILFLVEAKAGGFSAGASRGAPKSMIKAFSDLIIEGQRQSERAERYIKSADEVALFDQTGRQEVHWIKYSRFRKIFRIVITREGLGWVGASIATLLIVDPSLSKSYPWHISIDDLRIVAELFKDDEIRFVHYLELRLLASAETTLRQLDEIDHVGLYHKINYYSDLPVHGADHSSYAFYALDIDHYFADRALGDTPPVPTQKMPPKMRALIAALRTSRLPHRFEGGSVILSMDTATREELERSLDSLDEGRALGRQRAMRLPFTSHKVGFSVSYFDDSHWEEELRRSAVQMRQGNCDRWIVIQLANGAPYEVARIEVITPERFTTAELAAESSQLEAKTEEVIMRKKPARNDQCPCGSGKKFKKCHGFS